MFETNGFLGAKASGTLAGGLFVILIIGAQTLVGARVASRYGGRGTALKTGTEYTNLTRVAET